MKTKMLVVSVLLGCLVGCTGKAKKEAVWIYTSLYKDTIADIQPKLEKAFPNVEFKFYQAGSEEVAAKVQAESMAGRIQADLLISSDRFWYEDMGRSGKLEAYRPANSEQVPATFKHEGGFYTTVSYPVMVLSYNSEAVAKPPTSFKDLIHSDWKNKASSGSPLASGTNFTTVAFWVKAYGWDFFKQLRLNEFMAEGGNSGVIRRLQSKERPVGVVLLENILRLTNDDRIKFVIPKDGAILQSNVLALVKKAENEDLRRRVADWFFAKDGQEAMVRSFMYAAVPGYPDPKGAPSFKEIVKTARPWSKEFISEVLDSREKIKEEFAKIVF